MTILTDRYGNLVNFYPGKFFNEFFYDMYITITLEYQNDGLIEKIYKEGNIDYLMRNNTSNLFPYLSEIEMDDPSHFGPKHMDCIIEELKHVRKELINSMDLEHVNDIIRLASKCKDSSNMVLVFR